MDGPFNPDGAYVATLRSKAVMLLNFNYVLLISLLTESSFGSSLFSFQFSFKQPHFLIAAQLQNH